MVASCLLPDIHASKPSMTKTPRRMLKQVRKLVFTNRPGECVFPAIHAKIQENMTGTNLFHHGLVYVQCRLGHLNRKVYCQPTREAVLGANSDDTTYRPR